MSRSGELYPPLEPHRSGRLAVDEIHTLYWEESGNPAGIPVVFLHGGPGAGCSPEQRRFFDPRYYRIVLFDQRGAGRSTPHGEVRNNTPAHLVSDLEALRTVLEIPAWHVFGGSWGSTLAVAYAQEHPQACLSLTLRGVFLMRDVETDWFRHGMRRFVPQAWAAFAGFLPEHLRGDVVEGYWAMLNDPVPEVRRAAATSWAAYEGYCSTLRSGAPPVTPTVTQVVDSTLSRLADGAASGAADSGSTRTADTGDSSQAVGLARLEVHYMRANRFVPDDLLLQRTQRISHIPCAIVQGKYDLLCPPATAWALHIAWPGSTLQIIEDAGHSAREPGMRAALVAIMDRRAAPRPAE